MANEQPDAAAAPEPTAAAPSAEAKPVETGGKPAAEAALPTAKRTKKPGVPPRRGKKLRNHLRNVEKKLRETGTVPLKQAVAELKKLKRAKFDETVEVHINLGIDVTQSDQMVRGAIPLPHGIGKSVRVAVFAQGDNAAKAKAAGADIVGAADLVEKVQKEGFLEFDVVIATQDMMAMVSRLGKVLGPRGLMPTPKAGTVVPASGNLEAAVREFKAGKVEYRSDKTGQIHAGVGKMSFDEQKLVENINVFVEQVRNAKPSGVKGNFINGVVLSATMSPGIRVSF
ncbi:50s ribosomal protein l1 : 50S ribosomal protein L1 OS=Thermosipho melanesiensis (strain BI429 / DSM 12029) GN=rplA PE=3 SV=1: Ribosomal_L1 [Gemmataceae bacterium]|nr:50s ribosomal protein l1 : 50S ribosomal protein L1 OS=Thermosipho melanesiensis (strain BI429 / DSM 12029) GN=rplA PE=3 SV=1: Ribosomal_L1 [Gemmataceae bacterium]VTT98581.1 50s ribosomal protein l1 : 50S ribosomal protein L1 OS=Thermosipho melanesiensis (strain BI429 / DSM 12029) GN=rplA PE=3 SV=1: Ribosomal_L1 [Gemmataceae bacterium]